jgi:Secretion system C-terminal sorting domain
MQQQTSKNVTALNVSKLSSGIYMLTIKEAEATRSIKFVKE